ncbi:MAG: glutamate--tRNA ligase, partial [Actinomycetota bacterium]
GPEVGGPDGPYRQSERLERYREAAERLLASGAVYRCYCTPEELGERSKASLAAGKTPGYDGRCRHLSDVERRDLEASGRSPALRFAMPEGESRFEDLVRGQVEFRNSEFPDFVIMRSDGSPTYLLAAAVDDMAMRITHIVRGEDLLPATPRQIAIYRALGSDWTPRFAHLPLLVGTDRRPLSKRHGSVAVEAFRDQGILPEALINYLALLGWSFDEKTEYFTMEELVGAFSLERVSRNPAAFDPVKLAAMNGHYIRGLTVEELAERTIPFLAREGLVGEAPSREQRTLVASAAPLIQERVQRLDETVGMLRFLLVEDMELDPAGAAKVLTPEGMGYLEAAVERLDAIEGWSHEAIESCLRGLQEERGLKPKAAFQPVRLAITGTLVSPPLFESMALLGRDRCLARIRSVLSRGKAAT